MVCLALELVGSWMELCFSAGMESGVLWFSQVLYLGLLPLAFSLILTVASRLLHPYSNDDKTSSLMVKRFSTVRDTQSVPQGGTHREVHRVTWRRGRKEIEVSRRRRGGVKRRETDLTSNQFPTCSPQPGTPRDSQSWVEKRRGREEIEATWWRKRRVQRGREQSSQ